MKLSVWRQSDPRSYLAVEHDIDDYDSSDVEYLRCFKLQVQCREDRGLVCVCEWVCAKAATL